MQTITTTQLEVVSGGASKSTEISSALTGVKDALNAATTNKNSSGGLGDPMTMMMMGLMMSQKNQGPTVVAGAPAAPAVVGGPVINVNTRVRRGW
jgi:hypothetical protein